MKTGRLAPLICQADLTGYTFFCLGASLQILNRTLLEMEMEYDSNATQWIDFCPLNS